MFCTKCGNKVGDGNLVCSQCGTPVIAGEELLNQVRMDDLGSGDVEFFTMMQEELKLPEEKAGTASDILYLFKPIEKIPTILANSIYEPAEKSEDTASPPASETNKSLQASGPENIESPTEENTPASDDNLTQKLIFKYIAEKNSGLEKLSLASAVSGTAQKLIFKNPYENERGQHEESSIAASRDTPQQSVTEIILDEEHNNMETTANDKRIPPIHSAAKAAPLNINEFDIEDDNAETESEEVDEPTEPLNFDNEFKPTLYNEDYEDGAKAEGKEKASLKKETVITSFGWLGILLLLLIPVVNIVLLFVWAFGGCKKRQKTTFARGFLMLLLIFTVIYVLCVTVFRDYTTYAISQLPGILDTIYGFIRVGIGSIQGLLGIAR